MQKHLSSHGYTLMEIMLVIAIIGILVSALSTSYSSYQKRARDTVRITALDNIGKAMQDYFSDNEKYPDNTGDGCVPNSDLSKYVGGNVLSDPLITNNNGCNTDGKYSYGMSTGLTSSANEFVLVARLEIPAGGNYNGAEISGLTGQLTQTAYNDIQNLVKGAGQYQVFNK